MLFLILWCRGNWTWKETFRLICVDLIFRNCHFHFEWLLNDWKTQEVSNISKPLRDYKKWTMCIFFLIYNIHSLKKLSISRLGKMSSVNTEASKIGFKTVQLKIEWGFPNQRFVFYSYTNFHQQAKSLRWLSFTTQVTFHFCKNTPILSLVLVPVLQ